MKTILFAATAAMALGLAVAAHADTRGPDSYGYAATDQVTYTFNDITTTGTQVLANVDDFTAQVSLGMNFNFYGSTYTSAYLSSNGVIMFGGPDASYSNYDLTASQFYGGPAIFTFWDDLVTWNSDPARGVYYETIGETPGSRKFVVQQIANSYSIGGSSINFQTVLDEASGDILMRYTQTVFGNAGFDHGASATVGIQGQQSLGEVVQWSHNQPVLLDNQSICFTTNANAACNAIVDAVGGVPEPGTWAMMILGLGGAGAMVRRARRVPAAA
jgi:PEP-CTERM motif